MKYITSHFRDFCQEEETPRSWNTETDLVICSFFFWKLGSSLQKNYVGLLRSLLYQIAEQREDLIAIMIGQQTTLNSEINEAPKSALIHAWTKERLDHAWRQLIVQKPASTHLCLFVDGLDEFEGDEDSLLEMVDFLGRDPGTRICVSSRPEQMFRRGFLDSPQLKLQDLNYPDIERATRERLDPTLKQYFPDSTSDITRLVKSVTTGSQGVFLWADLICKDLKNGARNADSMEELFERLKRIPTSIEGLYTHMLDRADKSYLQEGTQYLQMLLTVKENDYGLTLLEFACAQEACWEHVLTRDSAYFQSSKFHDSCLKLETRILTRCMGLVNISEHRQTTFREVSWTVRKRAQTYHGAMSVSQVEGNVSRELRQVSFIHRTVAEYLKSHGNYFRRPNWQQPASLAVIRGRIGVLSIVPIMILQAEKVCTPIIIDEGWTRDAILPCPAMETCDRQLLRNDGDYLIDQFLQVISYVNRCLNGVDFALRKGVGVIGCHNRQMPDLDPFENSLGFAAYFGCHGYVSRYVSLNSSFGIDLDYILTCAIAGLGDGVLDLKLATPTITGLLNIMLDCLHQARRSETHFRSHHITQSVDLNHKWYLFIKASVKNFERHGWEMTMLFKSMGNENYNPQDLPRFLVLWKDVVALFLEHCSTPDVIMQSRVYPARTFVEILKKFPLYGNVCQLQFDVEETILTAVTTLLSSTLPDFTSAITALLRLHGAHDRRSLKSVRLLHMDHSETVLGLTCDQSERLQHAWPLGKRADGRWFTSAQEDEEPRPSEPGPETEQLVNDMINEIKILQSNSTR